MSLSQPAPLRVLFLGPLRDKVGCESAEISFPADGAQPLFWAALQKHFPAIQAFGGTLRLARDNDFLESNAPLQPGDEVALISPVSGG